MPRYDPRAIANEFLERRSSTAWPAQMQIQKLVHIANGWNLAINGEPLVNERPQAWDNGPVFRSIWNEIRDAGYRGPNCTLLRPFSDAPYKAELSGPEKAILDHVWAKYGSYTGQDLSRMTHRPETPWFKAYSQRGRNAELDENDIRNHYIELGLAGRRT